MTKLSIDNNEYEIDDMTDDQKEIINILAEPLNLPLFRFFQASSVSNVGSNASALLSHISQCVSAVQQMKTNELKQSLEGNEDDQSQ